MILEGLVTTINHDGSLNVSPMGPVMADERFERFQLRPFATSQTYGNLAAHGEGVLHVTDDVEMIAYAAVGNLSDPRIMPAPGVRGWILSDACRWYAFRVTEIDTHAPRVEMHCSVIAHGALREFWGLNRAKHAVLESAILATRVHLLDRAVIEADLARLAPLVEKTGGASERRAFAFLMDYIRGRQ